MSKEEKCSAGVNDLVVVGSSAGGVGALSVLVSTIPKEFPAPIVLAQHLDPHRPSNLDAVLERRSTLPVIVVSDSKPTPLEGGKIYVVPANRHVRIADGHVLLEGDHGDRPRPSVDLLLSSAAKAYGEHLIAVVLTGSGSDGAAGAVDVKEAGGTVIIQNPETAQYPSMPLSLPPTAVDHVAELEQIGQLLYDLILGLRIVPEVQGEDPVHELLTYVSRQTNIDFRTYKPSTIMRRIARRMAVTHNQTVRDYMNYVETRPDELQELVKAFLIKVTGFFRDPEAFEFLRETLLPLLIEQGREQGRVLRFWSAGCATGEEPYSLAILIADMLGPELPEWSIKIFATDLDESAINFARRGFYPANILEELPDDYRARFFERADGGYHVLKLLRQLVIFGHQDLSRGVPFPRIDLVMCRNLLIYLKPELQQNVLDLFAYSLHQTNGYLFLGKAETTRPTKATFETVNKKWKIYRCTSGPLTPIAELSGSGLRLHSTSSRVRNHSSTGHAIPSIEAHMAGLDLVHMRRFTDAVLRYLPVGIVIIDHLYRIVTINSSARRLLGLREAAHDQDFLHASRGLPYSLIRNAIDSVLRDRAPIALNEVEIDPSSSAAGRYFHISVTLMQADPPAPELVVLSVADATEQVQTKRRLEATQAEQTQLVSELSATNRRFSDMNKELQDANEELQATNEELETNNEELETNNEELQATNEELQTTNDELTARTVELQEITREFASERARLTQVFEHAPFNIISLKGPGLIIQSLSRGYSLLFAGREIEGLPLEEIFAGDGLADFVKSVRAAYQTGKAVTVTHTLAGLSSDDRERAFLHHIVTVHDGSGRVGGVNIYSEDTLAMDPRLSGSSG